MFGYVTSHKIQVNSCLFNISHICVMGRALTECSTSIRSNLVLFQNHLSELCKTCSILLHVHIKSPPDNLQQNTNFHRLWDRKAMHATWMVQLIWHSVMAKLSYVFLLFGILDCTHVLRKALKVISVQLRVLYCNRKEEEIELNHKQLLTAFQVQQITTVNLKHLQQITHDSTSHLRYQILIFFSRLIFLCNCKVP